MPVIKLALDRLLARDLSTPKEPLDVRDASSQLVKAESVIEAMSELSVAHEAEGMQSGHESLKSFTDATRDSAQNSCAWRGRRQGRAVFVWRTGEHGRAAARAARRAAQPRRSAFRAQSPNQFQSVVPNPSLKLRKWASPAFRNLAKMECADLQEAVDAIQAFLGSGPNKNYVYDNFRAGSSGTAGTRIGGSRFWLSSVGKELSDATP